MVSRRIYDHLPLYTKVSDRINLIEKICDSFQQGYYDVEDILSNLYLYFDPDLAPSEYLDWLGQLVGLFPVEDSAIGTGIPKEWEDSRKRFAIKNIQFFLRQKGSHRGLRLGYKIWLFQKEDFESELILIKSKQGKIIEENDSVKVNDLALEYDGFNIDNTNFSDFRFWRNTQNTIFTSNNKSINRYTGEEIKQTYIQNSNNPYDLHVTVKQDSVVEGSTNFDRLNQEILPTSATPNPYFWSRNVSLIDTNYLNNNNLLGIAHKSKNWRLTLITSQRIYILNPLGMFFIKLNDDLNSIKQDIVDNLDTNFNISSLNNYYLNLNISNHYQLPFYNSSSNFSNLILQFPFYSEKNEVIQQTRLDLIDAENQTIKSILVYGSDQKITLTPHHITSFEFVIPNKKLKFFGLHAIADSQIDNQINASALIQGDFDVNSSPSKSESYRLVDLNVVASEPTIRVFFNNANTIRVDVFSDLGLGEGDANQFKGFDFHFTSTDSNFSGSLTTTSNNTLDLVSSSASAEFDELKVDVSLDLDLVANSASTSGDAYDVTPIIIESADVTSESASFIGSGTRFREVTFNVTSEDSTFTSEGLQVNPSTFDIVIENEDNFVLFDFHVPIIGESLDIQVESSFESEGGGVNEASGAFTSLNSSLSGTITTS